MNRVLNMKPIFLISYSLLSPSAPKKIFIFCNIDVASLFLKILSVRFAKDEKKKRRVSEGEYR